MRTYNPRLPDDDGERIGSPDDLSVEGYSQEPPARQRKDGSAGKPPSGSPSILKPTQQRPASRANDQGKPQPARPGSVSKAPATPKKPVLKDAPPAAPRQSLPGVEGIVVRSRTPAQPNGLNGIAGPAPEGALPGIIPSFLDEILAFLLIAAGLLSFVTLLTPTSGALGSIWSGVLRQAFGVGAFIISAAILLAGALLLMPKLGVRVRINWWRIVCAELFFVFLLALIHTGTRVGFSPELGREEAFASAMEGQGGGFVGWAVQDVIHMLLGDTVTGLVLLALLIVSGGAMLGVRRREIVGGLARMRRSLIAFAWRMEGQSAPPEVAEVDDDPPPVAGQVEKIDPPPDPDPPAWRGDGLMMVELPPIPGRPSIITGEVGAGALVTRRPGPGPLRISALRGPDGSLLSDPLVPSEIRYRFTVRSLPDKKKIRKRSTDLPPLELLEVIDYGHPDDDEININAQIIEETVEDFGMNVEVVGVKSGPTVTQYAVQPFAEVDQGGKKVVQRVRVTRVASLAQDLSLALAAPRVRIQAPVPGTNYIGIEVPNARPGIVSLRPILESEQFYKFNKAPLAIALGREVDGRPFAADLSTMPHLLIGGTTGSGKSVCLTSITTCLVMNNRPDEMRLIMIDPKMVELVRFNGLPHLYGHVEVELERIIGVLRWATREMDRRYRLMEAAQARNIAVYNQGRRKRDRLPHIVILVDELAEMMTEFPDETEHLLTRLAQMARATGIHLVVATQRPSTDIVTGLIKANFPARIAFAVASGIDSRVIIDSVGAEDLIGRGDMLFYASDAAGPIRLQGCFVSDVEMEHVVEFWRARWKTEEDEEAPWERSLTRAAVLDETDQMLEEAIRLIQREGEASASLLQRKLNVSYPRAGRLIDALYKIGVVGEPVAGGRVRRVLITPDVDPTSYIVTWRNNNQ